MPLIDGSGKYVVPIDQNGDAIDFATADNQTSGAQKMQIVDANGNPVSSNGILNVHQSDTSWVVEGRGTAGSALAGNALAVAAVDVGGVKRNVLCDTSGRIIAVIVDSAEGAVGASAPTTALLIAGKDGSGNLVVPTITAGDLLALAKLRNAAGTTINPATEDGNLATAAARLTSIANALNVNLSTIASLANQTNGAQKSQIVDAAGNVVGLAAAGAAPTGNPLDVAGVDGGGLKRRLLLDATGKLRIVWEDPAEGSVGSVGPASAIQIGGRDVSGNLQYAGVLSSLGLPALHVVDQPRAMYDLESGRVFYAVVSASIGTSETNLVYFLNPAANTKTLLLDAFSYSTTSTTNDMLFRHYLGTTVSGTVTGTNVAESNGYTGSSASTITALSATLGGGTITRGTQVDFVRCPARWITMPGKINAKLDPGRMSVITAQGTGAGTNATVVLVWREI